MVGIALVVGCATTTVKRQRMPDGSWQLTCQMSMDACAREADLVCKDKRYRIVAGKSETRRRDAPPYETEYHTSYLTFVCGEENVPPPAAASAPTSPSA